MECKRRSKCQRLIRRGWARIKATVAKWEEGLKERKGRLFDRLSYLPIVFSHILFPSTEARRLSQASLDSPLARLTSRYSSTGRLTHPTASSANLIQSSTDSLTRIESSAIVRIVSHNSLSSPTLVGTSVAAAGSSLTSTDHRVSSSLSRTRTNTITTIAESSTTMSSEEGGRRQRSIPNPGVEIKTFRRLSMVDGGEDFEEIHPQEGEKRVDFVWGKGVDEFIPPVKFESDQEGRKGSRKISKCLGGAAGIWK